MTNAGRRKRYVRIDYGNGIIRYFSKEMVRRLGCRSHAALRELTRDWAESLPPLPLVLRVT